MSRFACVLMLTISAFAAKPRSNAGPGDDVIPVIIVGGEWTTAIVFNNTNDLQVQFPLNFFNQDGLWELPVKGHGPGSQFNVTIPPRGTLKIEFDSVPGGPFVGFGMIDVPCNFDPGTYCSGVGTYTVLRNHNSARRQDFEVSYQLASTIALSQQQFLFDQSNFAQMVLNLTNYCTGSFCDADTIALQLFDEKGESFFSDIETVAPGEVKIINFAQMSSKTWDHVGMVRLTGMFHTVVTGHRINETGSFTPLYSYNYNF